MARGASIPPRLLMADAALNVGLGAYETSQGHTITGPLQMVLGSVGAAGLRRPGGFDPLIDADLLVDAWLVDRSLRGIGGNLNSARVARGTAVLEALTDPRMRHTHVAH